MVGQISLSKVGGRRYLTLAGSSGGWHLHLGTCPSVAAGRAGKSTAWPRCTANDCSRSRRTGTFDPQEPAAVFSTSGWSTPELDLRSCGRKNNQHRQRPFARGKYRQDQIPAGRLLPMATYGPSRPDPVSQRCRSTSRKLPLQSVESPSSALSRGSPSICRQQCLVESLARTCRHQCWLQISCSQSRRYADSRAIEQLG